MNSILVPQNAARFSHRPSGRHTDDYFFGTMSLLILGTVYLGFAHSYYLAGAMRAPLPSTIIHIHAVVFSAWILLFIIQTALVLIGRVNWHKKLGIMGAILAGLVVVLGVMAIINSTRRHFTPPGLSAGRFLAIDLLQTLVFGLLVSWGLRLRRDGPAHKRLILLANIVLLGAPIARWPFHYIQSFPPAVALIIDGFLLSLIVFDLFTRRRIHRVTLWGCLLIFLMPRVAFGLLGPSPLWVRFTELISLRETILPSASKSSAESPTAIPGGASLVRSFRRIEDQFERSEANQDRHLRLRAAGMSRPAVADNRTLPPVFRHLQNQSKNHFEITSRQLPAAFGCENVRSVERGVVVPTLLSSEDAPFRKLAVKARSGDSFSSSQIMPAVSRQEWRPCRSSAVPGN